MSKDKVKESLQYAMDKAEEFEEVIVIAKHDHGLWCSASEIDVVTMRKMLLNVVYSNALVAEENSDAGKDDHGLLP